MNYFFCHSATTVCHLWLWVFAGWEAGGGGETAHTNALSGSSGKSDVAGFAPGSTPGVLDLVVKVAVFGAITNSEDSVVEVGTAGPVVEDTVLVVLHQTSIHGNGNWLLINSGNHFVVVVSWNIDQIVVEEIGSVFAPVAMASVGRGVWHSIFSDDTVGFGPHHSDGRVSTVATHVWEALVAQKEEFFGIAWQGVVELVLETFHGAGGGESPARTASALVFDWSDSTISDPISFGGNGQMFLGSGVHQSLSWLVSSVGGPELLDSQIREFVVTSSPGELWGSVDLVNLLVVSSEDRESVVMFFLRKIVFAVLNLPGFPGAVNFTAALRRGD